MGAGHHGVVGTAPMWSTQPEKRKKQTLKACSLSSRRLDGLVAAALCFAVGGSMGKQGAKFVKRGPVFHS